jgi:hypothetical protein
MSARAESPCGHYSGLKRAHCYKCLHEDRKPETRDAFEALFRELFKHERGQS